MQITELDLSIKEKIGNTLSDEEIDGDLVGIFPEVPDDIILPNHDAEHDPLEADATILEADNYTPETYDKYLTAAVLLPNMGTVTRAKVIVGQM